jgi:hypothetical protein
MQGTLMSDEQELFFACVDGDAYKVRYLLESNPNIDVNYKERTRSGHAPLHRVCCDSDLDEILDILLSHHNIDVNVKDGNGYTPLQLAIRNGRTDNVRILLKDPRVSTTTRDAVHGVPLQTAVVRRHLGIIKRLIASGRSLFNGTTDEFRNEIIGAARVGKYERTPLQLANNNAIFELLDKYSRYPNKTRFNIRIELGCHDQITADVFALVIFLSDGLLRVKTDEIISDEYCNFFNISKRLPMELQMLLCNRALGSMKDSISFDNSEVAFKQLAQNLL